MRGPAASPWRVLLPAAIGTGLSLFGDSTLYAVLPTHTAEAGVTLASVGILLSANRFVRVASNGPAGAVYERWPRRPLFVGSLLLGACSTAIGGLTQGFWPLLAARLLWGLSWSGIWVGGNTAVLDVAGDSDRGRWVGRYNVGFFLGAAGGALMGGLLTDELGYHRAMIVSALLTLAGALVALLWLPETRGFRGGRSSERNQSVPRRTQGFGLVIALLVVHRLAVPGILSSTLGRFLLDLTGEQARVGGLTIRVASLTGLALGSTTLIAMMSAPLIGGLSDKAGSRWGAAAGGLLPGVAGFGLLAVGLPATALIGVPLIAVTSGSNQGLSTVLLGDLSGDRYSRRLGVLFTAGDLASAVGPPLAYALMPAMGLQGVYWMVSGLLALLALVMLRHSTRPEKGVK